MGRSDELLIQRRDKAFGRGAALFYDTPLHLVRGEGVHLFDAEGRRYVDLYNNVPCVGHSHPHVVEAIARQVGTYNCHSRYLHEAAIELAERIAGLHGNQIESVLFSCTGTEANEAAIRMARFATGRTGIVCTDKTYHGNSELVSKLSLVGTVQPESEGVHAFPFPQTYRPLVPGADEDALCDAYLAALEDSIRRFEKTGVGFAALIMCSIFANEGLPDIPRGFMARATELVHRAGGLVIADEVQAGYARTGRWWGYETSGFVPDIVVTGKPMGNGVPLAATATSAAILEGFRARIRYFNTFASSPLQAAAGLAVIDVIENEDLLTNARTMGARLFGGLTALRQDNERIGDIRARGLFLGVEIVHPGADRLPDPQRASHLANKLKDLGFLTTAAGALHNMIKIRPPMVFTAADADAFLAAWAEATAAVLHD